MDELACFAPGMLALGSMDATADKAKVYLNTAKEVRPHFEVSVLSATCKLHHTFFAFYLDLFILNL